jgi:hypothetical protein
VRLRHKASFRRLRNCVQNGSHSIFEESEEVLFDLQV